MNGITQAVFVIILWLVMGIGFLSKATESRRQGRTWSETLTSIEALLFFLSLLAPLVLAVIGHAFV